MLKIVTIVVLATIQFDQLTTCTGFGIRSLDADVGKEVTNSSRSRRSLDTGISTEHWKLILSGLALSFCFKDHIVIKEDDDDNCMIDIKKLKVDHALIIEPDDHTKFKNPKNDDGVIVMKEGEKVFLSCGVNQQNYMKITPQKWESQTFKCEKGAIFKTDNQRYNIYDLRCLNTPKYVIRPLIFGPDNKFTEYIFGFESDSKNSLVEVNSVITSYRQYPALVTHSIIPAFIDGQQKYINPLEIVQQQCCDHHNTDMNEVFYFENQEKTFEKNFVCSASEGDGHCNYINATVNSIFSRTLLTPRTSFMYSIAGNATFTYLNTAPMWIRIFFGNAFRIEAHIHRFVRELKRDIHVYTGIGGELSLKDGISKRQMKLESNAVTSFQIPEYFYKIAIDETSHTGVVFITINNPHIDREEIDKIHLCQKPIIKSPYVEMPANWMPEDLDKGYSFMCEVQDFLQTSRIVEQTELKELGNLSSKAKSLLYIPIKGFSSKDFLVHDEVSNEKTCPTYFPPILSTDTTCKIEFQKRWESEPIVVDPDTLELIYPNEKDQIVIKSGQTVTLTCGQHNLQLRGEPKFKNFTCQEDQQFRSSDGNAFLFDDINCIGEAIPELGKEEIDEKQDLKHLSILLNVDENKYIRLLKYTYQHGKHHFPYYVETVLAKSLSHLRQLGKSVTYDHSYPSTMSFVEHDQESDFTNDYDAAAQRSSFLAQELTDEARKGHLLVPQLLITQDYFLHTIIRNFVNVYLNTRPMWETIANGNWYKTERHVLLLPAYINRNLKVYSGARGVLRTWHKSDGQYHPLLLNTKRSTYVIPRYFFKIVVDSVTRSGIVYVTMNDPWTRRDPDDLSPVCSQPLNLPKFELPNWNNTNNIHGRSFVCTVHDYMLTTFDFLLRSELYDVRDILSISGARYPIPQRKSQNSKLPPWEEDGLLKSTTESSVHHDLK